MSSDRSVTLRPATADDAERLLRWRNDPFTRQMAKTQDQTEWEEHIAWLQSVLVDDDRTLWVAEDKGVPVGRFRVDYRGDTAVLTWAVAPEHRKQGYGTAIVQEGISLVRKSERVERIVAKIRPKNIASKKIADRVGLERKKVEDDLEVWEFRF